MPMMAKERELLSRLSNAMESGRADEVERAREVLRQFYAQSMRAGRNPMPAANDNPVRFGKFSVRHATMGQPDTVRMRFNPLLSNYQGVGDR